MESKTTRRLSDMMAEKPYFHSRLGFLSADEMLAKLDRIEYAFQQAQDAGNRGSLEALDEPRHILLTMALVAGYCRGEHGYWHGKNEMAFERFGIVEPQ